MKRCSMTGWNAGSFDENVIPRLTWISCVAFSPGGVSAPTITSSSGCELLAGSGLGDEVPGQNYEMPMIPGWPRPRRNLERAAAYAAVHFQSRISGLSTPCSSAYAKFSIV